MSEVYFGEVCIQCRAGLHRLCSSPGVDDVCCCRGEYVLEDHLRSIEIDEAVHRARVEAEEELQERLLIADNAARLAPAPKKKGEVSVAPEEATPREVGESGYIDPAAWNSTSHIGTLKDPKSTGRKRAAVMYPIAPGQVCEWARLKNAGGGPHPILGCLNNPASEWHHGPDKNTLNNAKASRGIGNTENLHIICSECHNLWHEMNNRYYPDYDRVEDQEKPWLPYTEEPWGPQTPEPASIDELMEQETRREQQRRERGREHRGRNAAARPVGDGPELIDDGDGYEPEPDDPRLD